MFRGRVGERDRRVCCEFADRQCRRSGEVAGPAECPTPRCPSTGSSRRCRSRSGRPWRRRRCSRTGGSRSAAVHRPHHLLEPEPVPVPVLRGVRARVGAGRCLEGPHLLVVVGVVERVDRRDPDAGHRGGEPAQVQATAVHAVARSEHPVPRAIPARVDPCHADVPVAPHGGQREGSLGQPGQGGGDDRDGQGRPDGPQGRGRARRPR